MTSDSQSPDEIEAEIAQTREQLGHTVEQLGDKLDVKKQAGEKLSTAKSNAQANVANWKAEAQRNPTVPIAIAGTAAAVLAFVLWRRKRG